MAIDRALAQKMVDLLNEAYALDPVAMTALVLARVPCNAALLAHPTIQVADVQDGGPTVGILGIVNGICGADERGWGAVAANFDDDVTRLEGFSLLPEKWSGSTE